MTLANQALITANQGCRLVQFYSNRVVINLLDDDKLKVELIIHNYCGCRLGCPINFEIIISAQNGLNVGNVTVFFPLFGPIHFQGKLWCSHDGDWQINKHEITGIIPAGSGPIVVQGCFVVCGKVKQIPLQAWIITNQVSIESNSVIFSCPGGDCCGINSC